MIRRRRPSPEELAFLAGLRELEPEIRLHLSRTFPDVTQAGPLVLEPLPVECAHWMAVAAPRGRPECRVLVKGPRKYGADPDKMAMERDLLERIVPEITAANPSTRSPQLLASYPERQVLLLEMVDGAHLYSLLFGLRTPFAHRRLPGLLALCAEWLAGFHRLTRTGETGNPFDWIVEELEGPRTRELLDRYAGPEAGRAIREEAERARAHHPDLRQPLCLLHRRFAPYHVLVQGQRVYVFDLETRPARGYAYEDLAHFTTYYDILFPWRRAAGSLRMNLAAQQRAFLDAYARHAAPLSPAERIVMRFARLHALVIYAGDLEKHDTWKRRARGWVGRPWYRHRFRRACREELSALRDSSWGERSPARP